MNPLDKAWEAINALGGTVKPGDARGEGYIEAVGDALDEIQKLGGMDPLMRGVVIRDDYNPFTTPLDDPRNLQAITETEKIWDRPTKDKSS